VPLKKNATTICRRPAVAFIKGRFFTGRSPIGLPARWDRF